ncbi:NfeD family protein [Thermoactinomyces sp. DSM 45892]|uniref:NfeD family protein n=1 Tax=Thermoactinomyces sp. DSM 45892 TaxID=1882753 RepID=UPI00089B9A7F|nr:NfeD family protein [Thermoactinomyces sp. DSM 45892]SDY66915.1 membrane-bound serine protease (ClpP class) [Thermoactinomyces sp. DSM 45892]
MRRSSWMMSILLLIVMIPNQVLAAGSTDSGVAIGDISWLLWMLVSIGLLGLVLEVMIPGHFVSGFISIFSFATYFWLRFGQNETDWLIVGAFVAGFVLLFIEIFVPGFGILGALGIVGIFYAIIMAAPSIVEGVIALCLGLIIASIALWILYRFFGLRTKWGNLVLTSTQDRETGFNASKDRRHLMGKRGVTVTPLRTSGWVLFEHGREDVVSDGEMIPNHTVVEVTLVEGNRVVVSKVREDEGSEQ